jgi:putative hydrolase of the HAD superfamily
MQSRVHNVVFDFGAVLFTWQPGLLIKTHFPEHAATPEKTAALAQAVFGHADWHNFDRGVLSAEAVSQRTAARLGLREPALLALVEGIADHLHPMHESLTLLEELRELRQQKPVLRLYFLSNMPTPYARVLERKHAFLDWFDGGIFSGDVQHIKPEAEIYELLEARYTLEPAHTLFIDDLTSNVACAEARGWRGIRFESAAQLRAELLPLLA